VAVKMKQTAPNANAKMKVCDGFLVIHNGSNSTRPTGEAAKLLA